MTLTASLPMYDLPEMATANAAFWRAMREQLVRRGLNVGNCSLNADADRVNPGVIFTQTCGYPLVKDDLGKAYLLATPCYALPGCEGSSHRAFFIVRAEERATRLRDMLGRVFGCNSLRSNTGMNLPRLALARIADRQPFFSRVVITGSHLQSLERLFSGHIDVCSVDCVTWGFLKRFRPEFTARGRILAETDPSPSLPFVTTAATTVSDRVILKQALQDLFSDPEYAETRFEMALAGLACLEDAAYDKLLDYEREAAALGYPELQ